MVMQVSSVWYHQKHTSITAPPFLRSSPTCLFKGGFGYDSTDMAAIRYRLKTLKCDWIIGITDAGQVKPHVWCLVRFRPDETL